MLRVLTLSTLFPNPAQPGLGRFVERQTRGLAARPDVDLEVVAPIGLPPRPLRLHPRFAARCGIPESEQRGGVTVHHPRFLAWPVIGRRNRPGAIAQAVVDFLDVRGQSDAYDVIDAEFFWPDGPAAMRIAQRLNIPFSVKARGSDILFWGGEPGVRELILEAGRRAGGMLAVSDSLRDAMITLGLPADRIAVHRTGIDLDRFVPVDRAVAKASLGVAGPLLATVGNLVPAKRVDLAIAAVARVPEATLLVIGDGPERAHHEGLVRRLGLASRVRFLGAVPHEQMPGLLAAADILVHPSASEGLANVWVEALACGTPVVACDVGGARETIDRPAAGRLVEPAPAKFAAAIRALIAEPAAAEDVRAATEKFSWDRNRDALHGHLVEVVRSA